MFDGIYDEPVRDEALQMGFNPTAQDGRYTLILDARKYDEWQSSPRERGPRFLRWQFF